MENITENFIPFIDKSLITYRTCYHSIIFSPNRVHNDLQFYLSGQPQQSPEDLNNHDSSFVQWIINSFQIFAGQLKLPWILIHGDCLLSTEWRLRDEDLKMVRQKGLNVFMHEPLFIYNEDGGWPWMKNQGPPRYRQLEDLSDWVRSKGIENPVTVFLCEQGLETELAKNPRFANLKFRYFSSYVYETIEHNASNLVVSPRPRALVKKFICMNFRYEAIRELLVAYLVGRGYLSDSYISFFHSHNHDEFLGRLPFNPRSLKEWPLLEKAIEDLQGYLPLSLDTKNSTVCDPLATAIPDVSGHLNLRDDGLSSHEYFPRAFVFAYCESRPFSPRSEISEKTLRPIFYRRPFLPFAAPFFLKGLRELGFKTFGDYWDESFDNIVDDGERFSAYLKALDQIGSKSIPELRNLNEKIAPILQHNHRWAESGFLNRERKGLLRSQNFFFKFFRNSSSTR